MKVNGIIPYKKRIENNKQIGAVFGQKTQLWWDLPVIETFKLIKDMYEMTDEDYNKNLKEFSDVLELNDLLHKQVKSLSLGQKMRCEIAATFLHNPKIVYLDEPTIGLDVLVKEKIREFIKKVNKEKNTTVILTTHDLQDIEEVCNRIILIDKGKIIYDGEKTKFKEQFGKYTMVEFLVKNKSKMLSSESWDGFEMLEETQDTLKIRFNHSKLTVVDIVKKIEDYCTIEDIHMKEQGIEEILKEIYRGEITTC